ncbi:unnamed protein product [Dimorphilus gyrociliatus]|uniref:BZIP domain-containing protein n=1 Tax=Dimorphilus gyrociliatus TaxID=2664684 RepID=A0A7I8VVS3_9ANNE|nr:unnamed protein product [Dimorphilus gyrociliatus]
MAAAVSDGALDLSKSTSAISPSPEPANSLSSDLETDDMNAASVKEELDTETPNANPPSPSPSRPFKSYPFESLASLYGPLGLGAASPAPHPALYNPYAPGSTLGGLSALPGFDTAAVSLSSPIAQYLQQRRRRTESRSSVSQSASTSSQSSTNQLNDAQQPASSSSPNKVTNSGSEKKDDSYWERRRKNNEAAKRSRDARRAKEEEIAMRAAFLEQENLKLRAQVAILKNETAKLHYMLYNRM